jgi:hypothetical protein
MNPPPVPPSLPQKTPFARQAATAGLIAPLLAILVSAATAMLTQPANASPSLKLALGILCALFILAGFVFSIIALAGIHQDGSQGILAKSISGLAINGLLVSFFVFGFISAFNRARQSHQTMKETMATVSDLRSSVRRSFDPEKGITNTDLSHFDRLQTQFSNASQTLSGDDAIIVKAMQAYTSRMQTALQHYQVSLKKLTDAKVLSHLDLSDKKELADRREVVKQFMAVNGELKGVITNSEKGIEDDLVRLQLPPDKVRQFMLGYHSKGAPINALTSQIRDCDDQLGQAMLAALDMLDARWGEWHYDSSVNQIRFDDSAVGDAYREQVAAIQAAAQKQIGLQKKMVSLQ